MHQLGREETRDFKQFPVSPMPDAFCRKRLDQGRPLWCHNAVSGAKRRYSNQETSIFTGDYSSGDLMRVKMVVQENLNPTNGTVSIHKTQSKFALYPYEQKHEIQHFTHWRPTMNRSEKPHYLQVVFQRATKLRFPAGLRHVVRRFMLATAVAFILSFAPAGIVRAQEEFDSTYDKAAQNYRRANYEEALRFYKKANGLRESQDLDCLWGIAQTYSKLGARKNTLQICDQLIRMGGNDPGVLIKAWNLKGNTLSSAAMEKSGKPDESKLREAEAAYREVLKFSSELTMARYNLGVTLIRLNRLEEGLEELRAYVSKADDEDTAERARRIIGNPRRVIENFAPDFSLLTSDGEYISSEELRGKVLLLDFWGAWCPPCLRQIPFLRQLAKKYGNESFALISVDVNDDEAKWREHITKNKMNWTHARDANAKIQRAFQVNVFPSYFVIDHEGIIRFHGMGANPQTEGEIHDAIKKGLKSLATSPVRLETESAGSQTINLKNKLSSPGKDSTYVTGAPNAPSTDIAPPKVGAKGAYALRIPKPVIEILAANTTNMPPGLLDRADAYTVRFRNWASVPDELFTSSRDLVPCSVNAPQMPSFPSTRLEIIVQNEQGQILRAYCNPPRPEVLQNLLLVVPNQAKSGRICVTLKDRLTGNSVQSDFVTLPRIAGEDFSQGDTLSNIRR